jgi:ABC-type phosphate transport system substrate-binding protein
LRAILILIFLSLSAPIRAQQDGPTFYVIVNAKNKINEIDRKYLSDIFLKKITRWPDEQKIKPVDLGTDANVRSQFSEAVHHRGVVGVKSYWQQRIFSGSDLPPPEFLSEAEVIKYVSQNPGAIGYVSANLNSKHIKTISVR